MKPTEQEGFSEDSFHMVTQLNWENSIVWDGTMIDELKKSNKNLSADWLPSSVNIVEQNLSQRNEDVPLYHPTTTATALINGVASSSLSDKHLDHDYGHQHYQQKADTWDSKFAPVPTDLVHGRWEDEIIWDINVVEKLPKLPKVPSIDLLDERMVMSLSIPEDISPTATTTTTQTATTTTTVVKHKICEVKKSKILLSQAGIINVVEEQEEESTPPLSPKKEDKDPYNISNDEFYERVNVSKICVAGNNFRHSTPVVKLQAPYIPTCMGLEKLRNFHRPPLKRSSSKNLAWPVPNPILPLTVHIRKTAKAREQERLAAGGGDFFFMRTPADITGKNGELLLFEYSEEHPPLLSLVGMCSKIKNYYKRGAEKGSGPPEKLYGETTYPHTSPFLGTMHPGQQIQTIENNLYRAPVYDHSVPKTDFLLILTRENYFIRLFDAIFTVGQECPLEEVPIPNSARARNFVRDFLLVFIYRLFWRSRENPRQICMDDIKRAFPQLSDTILRNQLKRFADPKTINRVTWWVLQSDRRIPSEEEMQAAISPEKCCQYFSMIAAEQRLRDAGYGEMSIFSTQDNDDDDNNNNNKKMEDEIKAAPWNTTRAYIRATSGKCILDLIGPADPTGCGEGFSYTVLSHKGKKGGEGEEEEQEVKSKRPVAGTDADLRKLSLTKSKNILRSYGVPEEKMKKLSRKEAINLVRTLFTEKAKAGEKGMDKFSRGSKKSHQRDRYREDCQRIFDLQNKLLASHEVLSTDDEDESSAEELSDIEEMSKDIEDMLSNEKSSSQLRHEKEEQERRELVKTFMGDKKKQDDDKQQTSKGKNNNNNSDNVNNTLDGLLHHHPGRILKIHRTFKSPDGKEYVRTEIVRNAAIIDIYMRIRSTMDEKWIRQFAQEKEKKVQHHLVKLEGNKRGRPPGPAAAGRRQENKGEKKNVKCGACGAIGHMRTNKICPLYQNNTSPVVSLSSHMTMTDDEDDDEEETVDTGRMERVHVDGMKLHLSGNFTKQLQEQKLPPICLKIPKFVVGSSKRKRKRKAATSPHCDYLSQQPRTSYRRRVDPDVVMAD